MLVQIAYPVVFTEHKTVDMSEDQLEELQSMNLEDQAKYILNLDDSENMTDRKLIEGALDWGYAWIKPVE